MKRWNLLAAVMLAALTLIAACTATPMAPQVTAEQLATLSYTAQPRTVTFNWPAVPAGTQSVVLYRNGNVIGQTASPTALSIPDGGVVPGQTVTYQLGVWSNKGSSTSLVFTVTTPLAPVDVPPVVYPFAVAAPAPVPAPSPTPPATPSQTVAQAAAASIDTAIKGQTVSVAQPLYSKIDHAAGVYTINPRCAFNNVKGIHSRAVYTSWQNNGQYAPTYMGGTVCAISTHVWYPAVGTVLKWVGDDGVVVTRRIVGGSAVPYASPQRPDIAQYYIDAPMPTVSPAKFCDPASASYIGPDIVGTPCLWIDSDGRACITDIGAMQVLTADNTGRKGYQVGCNPSSNAARKPWYFTLKSSGDPAFLVLGNQTVLLCTLTGWAGGYQVVGGSLAYYRNDSWLNPDWTPTSVGVAKTQQGWASLITQNKGVVNNADFSGYKTVK